MLVDVQQIIPPPEAAEYQVRVREKVRKEREARTDGAARQTYNLTLGSETFPDQTKGRSILRTFYYLVENGVTPEAVAHHCGRLATRALVSVDGQVGNADFIHLATAALANSGKRFDPTRYFCTDDDLVSVGARTYAFTNQWGGNDWHEAMCSLRDAFPDCRIVFTPAV